MERTLLEAEPATEGRRHVAAGTGPHRSARLAEILLLLWVLGVFYHFYESQGFFQLLEQVVR